MSHLSLRSISNLDKDIFNYNIEISIILLKNLAVSYILHVIEENKKRYWWAISDVYYKLGKLNKG